MSEPFQLAFPILIALVLSGISTFLARRTDKQFAVGSIALFLAGVLVSISQPNIFVHGEAVLWQGAYSTTFPLLSALYTTSHASIWRSLKRPGWLAFLSALPAAWFFASVGFWEVIS